MTDQQLKAQALAEEKRANAKNEQLKAASVAEDARKNKTAEKQRADELKETKRQNRMGNVIKGSQVITGAISKVGDQALKLLPFALANDPSWYNQLPGTVEAVAKLSYATPLGVDRYIGSKMSNLGVVDATVNPIGIMALRFAPTIGDTDIQEGATGLQLAGIQIFRWVRSAQSGSANYEYPDLMMYILAFDSIHMLWADIYRALRAVNTYSKDNWILGKRMVEAMGYNADSILENRAAIAAELNVWAAALAKYAIPSHIPYFIRHQWLAMNIFADQRSERSGYYVFSPAILWKRQTGAGTGLIPVDFHHKAIPTSAAGRTWASVRTLMNELLDAVANATDVATMSGDIMKKATASNTPLYTLDVTASLDDKLSIGYSEEVLTQVEACCITASCPTECFSVYQRDGKIFQGNLALSNDDAIRGVYMLSRYAGDNFRFDATHAILNTYKDPSSVTPDDNMVASRLAFVTRAEWTTDTRITELHSQPIQRIYGYGSEVVIEAFLVSANSYWRMSSFIETQALFDISQANERSRLHQFTICLRSFEWSPRIRLFDVGYSTDVPQNATLILDDVFLRNFTVVSSDTLNNMSRIALASEFGFGAFYNV